MSENVFMTMITGVILLVVGLGVTGIVLSAKSDGRVDYCYVETSNGSLPVYVLRGHRNWRPDREIGAFTDGATARAAAEAQHCEVR